MKLLAIKVQSYIDLITNSSSELFQLKTDNTVEQVDKALQEITTGYLKPILFDLQEYYKHKTKYQDLLDSKKDWNEKVFLKEQIIKEHPEYYIYNMINGWFFDKTDPEHRMDTYKRYLCNNYPIYGKYQSPNELQKKFRKFVLDDKEGYLSVYDITDNLLSKFLKSHDIPNVEDIWEWSHFMDKVENLDGCILVLSEDDNSIPYVAWDTINEMFNGVNYHLG